MTRKLFPKKVAEPVKATILDNTPVTPEGLQQVVYNQFCEGNFDLDTRDMEPGWITIMTGAAARVLRDNRNLYIRFCDRFRIEPSLQFSGTLPRNVPNSLAGTMHSPADIIEAYLRKIAEAWVEQYYEYTFARTIATGTSLIITRRK